MSGERFVLRDQRAQDIRRYDFLRDVQRLEDEVSEGRAGQGFAILLTNDPSYWQPPQRDETVDAAFRIHEGRNVNGELAWSQLRPVREQHGVEQTRYDLTRPTKCAIKITQTCKVRSTGNSAMSTSPYRDLSHV